jgi:hypothetical protein
MFSVEYYSRPQTEQNNIEEKRQCQPVRAKLSKHFLAQQDMKWVFH